MTINATNFTNSSTSPNSPDPNPNPNPDPNLTYRPSHDLFFPPSRGPSWDRAIQRLSRQIDSHNATITNTTTTRSDSTAIARFLVNSNTLIGAGIESFVNHVLTVVENLESGLELERANHRNEVGNIRDQHERDLKTERDKHERYLKTERNLHQLALENEHNLYNAKVADIDANYKIQLINLNAQIAQLQSIVPAGTTYGTLTPSDVWHQALLEHQTFVQPKSVKEDDFKDLLSAEYAHEADLYEPIVNLLNNLLLKDVQVGDNLLKAIDTHSKPFLRGRKPDVTIQVAPGFVCKPISEFVLTVFEVKWPRTASFDEGSKGQLLDQMHRILEEQPWRHFVWGLLTTLDHNCWIKLERPNRATELVGCDSFPLAMSFLLSHVLKDQELPNPPAFSPAFSIMREVLGITPKSVVGLFDEPIHGPGRDLRSNSSSSKNDNIVWLEERVNKRFLAVKRTLKPGISLQHEIDTLCSIRCAQANEPCIALPSIICYDESFSEFATTPVGDRIRPLQLSESPSLAATVLKDVFDAVVWLHRHHLVHRDVRWDNIVLHRGRGVLVDFGTAIEVPVQSQGAVPYSGGYLCCPPRLLEKREPLRTLLYTPRMSDDYMAFLLLILTFLHESAFRKFAFHRIVNPDSPETNFLLKLWDKLGKAAFWAPYVSIAQVEDNDVAMFAELKGIVDALVVFPALSDEVVIGSPAMTVTKALGSLNIR